MKKTRILLLMVSIFMLTGCSKNKKAEEKTTESEPVGMVIDTKEKKRSDVINNILVGRSKMSFNNVNYDIMSDGQFGQDELWGTFESETNKNTYIQIDAFDNEQAIYGDIYSYELEGVSWDEAEPVQYLNYMEEALQYSKDGKSLMYKARTGDVLFSVAMFGKKKLTEEEVLELKALAKGIKIEYVENQINPG
ncbi:hypothetical protein [Vagococcus fluvialis]|uniref:hypothetical protein n=1 Tax=Vagococcus fluvialis TaxID=2738 RepID=UPI001A8C6F3A|nr:hypothetical protein [Vagococcus fluvialis]MDR2278450.1 hypothetical protein [Vagococcus sp.]MBO0429412.1 hypothetical protein [Vagococcus fluvialis]MBO0438055.1 hypothetical protein [Vagococcus fluvialis]MBO0442609.1 hypothetical protein [Vagococcus fluvialis]MCM2139787.1 hypothetical protein [Vagococcus fluvialis]